MTQIYVMLISFSGLFAVCVWLLVKCVKLHMAMKRREILEDFGFIKDGLSEIIQKGKEMDDLCECLKQRDNTAQPIDIRDVEFDPSGTDLSNLEEESRTDIDETFIEKPSASLSFADIEAALEAGTFVESYKSDFLHQPDKKFKASSGKCVLIRPEHHRKIQRILSAVNAECVTIYGFIDNILCEHFSKNAVNIDEILNPNKTRL